MFVCQTRGFTRVARTHNEPLAAEVTPSKSRECVLNALFQTEHMVPMTNDGRARGRCGSDERSRVGDVTYTPVTRFFEL